MSYADAVAACADRGGTLASLTTAREWTAVWGLLESRGFSERVCMGLTSAVTPFPQLLVQTIIIILRKRHVRRRILMQLWAIIIILRKRHVKKTFFHASIGYNYYTEKEARKKRHV